MEESNLKTTAETWGATEVTIDVLFENYMSDGIRVCVDRDAQVYRADNLGNCTIKFGSQLMFELWIIDTILSCKAIS